MNLTENFRNRRTILVVDDEPAVLILIDAILNLTGESTSETRGRRELTLLSMTETPARNSKEVAA